MPEVPFEKFSLRFNNTNSFSSDILNEIKKRLNDQECIIGLKGPDLVELVRKMLDNGLTPIVDKKMGIVVGLPRSAHQYILYNLQWYYRTEVDKNAPWVNPITLSDTYIDEGRGYFMSSVGDGRITVGEKYKQDKFDKDLFIIHEQDTVPLGDSAFRSLGYRRKYGKINR